MNDYWPVIMVVLVVAIAAFAIYKAHKSGDTITVSGVEHTLEASVPLAQELLSVAQIAVSEAEQLKRTGKIASNDEAFNHALNVVKKWSPELASISNDKVISAINAAVLVASALRHSIEQDDTPMVPPGIRLQ